MPSTKSKPTPFKWHFEALGTSWLIETPRPLSRDMTQAILRRIQVFDETYSRFRDDSVVAQLRKPGTYVFPDDFSKLYGIYEQCYELTDGQMTPLIGSALEDAGYDADYRFKPREIQPVPLLEDVLVWDGHTKLTTYQPVVFDVGAAGKGYVVDLIAALLEGNGVSEYTIDASGDMRHAGHTSEVIGLEHPFDQTKVIGTMEIRNQSLCASASNRRAWGRLHHIMNARTRQPERQVVATWVVAADTLTADALATALFFVDDARPLLSRFDISYVRLYADGRLDVDPQFRGELFI